MKLSERLTLAHVAFLRRPKTFRNALIGTIVGLLMMLISTVAILTGAEFLLVAHSSLSWVWLVALGLSSINWEEDTFDRENVFGVVAIIGYSVFYIAANATLKPYCAGLTLVLLFVFLVAGGLHLLNQPPREIPMEMTEVEATIFDRSERGDRKPGGFGQ